MNEQNRNSIRHEIDRALYLLKPIAYMAMVNNETSNEWSRRLFNAIADLGAADALLSFPQGNQK